MNKDEQIKLLQDYCRSAWSRGFRTGRASMEQNVAQAVEALNRERQGRLEDNAKFTELLDDSTGP